MKRIILSGLTAAGVFSCQAQFTGAPGFFGGYADGVGSVPTGNNTIGPALRIVYDDFTFDLSGKIVGFEMVGRDNTGAPVGMYYEIRTGMSEGNGGTLLFSGTTLSAVAGDLPLNGDYGTPPPGTGNYRWYDSGPSSPIQLDPGTYWIGLAPVQQFGSFDLATTVGLGSVGHPIDDGNAFYSDSSDPLKSFASLGSSDFSLRVVTESTVIVPEPTTSALLGLGSLMIWFGLRKRAGN
ncbi:MAG TPA: PEP-CTERM sorting domain-containing protein [Verrucomicrobiota bacterium]|nr:PEP-CTERM sorting domain-containing protein [Verrucomicrobiota bacterium]